MFTPRTIVVMTASALATLGCASLRSDDSPKISIRPVERVHHGGDASAMYQTGRYFQGQIRYDKAIAAYQDALAANPRYADAHNGLAVIYSIQGKRELAEQEFKAAIAAAPNGAYLHNNLGYHYLQSGRLDEALAEFERAKELDPGNVRVATNLAAVRRQLGVSAAHAETAARAPAAGAASGNAVIPVEPSGAPAYTVETQDVNARPAGADVNAAAETTAQLAPIAPDVWELRSLDRTSSADFPRRSEELAATTASERSLPRGESKAITSHRLEIANGNGITGLARRIAALLTPRGFERIRLTNQEPYGKVASQIQYVTSGDQAAAEIKSILPADLPRLEVRTLPGDTEVRVVLGRDFSEHAHDADSRRLLPAQMAKGRIGVYPHSAVAIDFTGYPIEISNGNGTTGLAKRLAGTLKSRGIEGARLTNHKPFGQVSSQIQYVAGAERVAEQLNATLPVQLPVTQVPGLERNIGVKVLLGRDFPPAMPVVHAQAAAAGTLAAASVQ